MSARTPAQPPQGARASGASGGWARPVAQVAAGLLIVGALAVSAVAGIRLARASTRLTDLHARAGGLEALDVAATREADLADALQDGLRCAEAMLTPEQAEQALAALEERAQSAGVALSLAEEPTAETAEPAAAVRTYALTATGEFDALVEAVVRSGLAVSDLSLAPAEEGAPGPAVLHVRLTLVTADSRALLAPGPLTGQE